MGGMENPLLTFASPTIITGDKSQVYVATHEIAHSWTGNDVTCENWMNLWLNEGFTVFEERKVSGQIHGKDFPLVDAFLGNISSFGDMQSYGLDNTYSSLYPEVKNDFPDNSFSEIPYEKGFQFLYFIETLIGEDKMQQLLRTHISAHHRSSINYHAFRDLTIKFINENFDNSTATEINGKIDWEAWVKGPGLAPVTLNFTTPGMIESQSIADTYLETKETPSNVKDFDGFYSSLKVVFIERLIKKKSQVDVGLMEKIDADLNITNTVNPELKQRWFPLGIEVGYTAVMEPARQLVSSVGRAKYLTPIYQALLDNGMKSTAEEWYQANIDFYHPYVVYKLGEMIKNYPGKYMPETPEEKAQESFL